MKIYSSVEMRENFSDVLNIAAYGKVPVVVERRGKPICGVISYKEFQEYEAWKAQKANNK